MHALARQELDVQVTAVFEERCFFCFSSDEAPDPSTWRHLLEAEAELLAFIENDDDQERLYASHGVAPCTQASIGEPKSTEM